MPGYVEDYIKEQEHEAVEEKEWREREGESIPAWMDEEEISSREYEGLDEDYGHYANDAEERESSSRIKAW